MINKRIPAFTLMEATVAMLISAIAIGLTYTAYLLVLNAYHQYQERNKQSTALMLLNELLIKDFNRSAAIYRLDDGLECRGDSQHVIYQITSDEVIRQAGVIDTFKFKTASATYLFEGKPVNAGAPAAELSRMDDFNLMLLVNKDSIPYHYHKQYSAVDLISRTKNADR